MVLSGPEEEIRYIRNIKKTWQSFPDTPAVFIHHLNGYGFRDKAWRIKKSAGKKRVIFAGDSFVEGCMAGQDQTIPGSFEATAKGACEVFNAGMMGVGIHSYIQFLVDAIPIFQPDLVFLVLYANDVPFGREYIPYHALEPEYHAFFMPRIWEIVKSIRENHPLPFRWLPSNESYLPAVPSSNNPWTKDAAQLEKHVTPEIAQAMKAGQYNFFRTNWVLKEATYLNQPKSLYDQLVFLRNYGHRFETELVVCYIPSRHQVSRYYYPFEKASCQIDCPDTLDMTTQAYQVHRQQLKEDCENLGLRFIDLTEPIKVREDQQQHLYWNYDDHMRGWAYEWLGREIYEEFRQFRE